MTEAPTSHGPFPEPCPAFPSTSPPSPAVGANPARIGPSLSAYGITGALSNPTLQLVRMSDGATIAINDDWGSDPNAFKVVENGLAPSDPHESAIFVWLDPGAYTAIVSGANGGTGVGMVEVYQAWVDAQP